jgi:hypothetical protein
MQLSRFARFITLLLAAIQFAAPAVASVAEGAFSRRVADPQSHVEEYGQNKCTPAHPADCAICRFLSGNASETPVVASLAIPTALSERPLAVAETAVGAARRGFDARGPPAIAG